jgi:acetyltransferase-like isoleucine patch superfamily enzyme
MEFSPIVLFAYNRPIHTKKVLDALAINPEAINSELYIFCDGAKVNASNDDIIKVNQVISLAKNENRFKNVNITIQEINKGLANSIIEGVTQIVNKHGRIIVLEDDIVTSDGFLKYMNDALNFYENNSKVMHISGYMYPHHEKLPETFFYNVTLCWGWATWSKAWAHFDNDALTLWKTIRDNNLHYSFDKFGDDYLSSQLAYNILGKLNTWFIKWHASVLIKNGFTLFPNRSLVQNIGFDNTGVHNGSSEAFNHSNLINNIKVEDIAFSENKEAEKIIKGFYKNIRQNPSKYNFKRSIKKKIRNLVFLIFPDLKDSIKNSHQNIQTRTYLGFNCKITSPYRLSNSILGNYTYVSENSVINNVIIGKFCSIGANFMAGRGIHPTNGISTHPMFYSTAKQNGMTLCQKNKIDEFKQIIIGNDVFIGMNVTVLDGVTIGDGAIIGAGSVVSKNIPAYAIAYGNPIKIAKYRFEKDIIDKLLKVKWWNFNTADLNLIENHFFEIEDFIRKVEKENG